MNIAIVGAGGNAGSRITTEALRRGHQVTALGRNPANIEDRPNVRRVAGDANDPAALAPLLAGADAVVSTVRFADSDPQQLIDAVRRSGVKRYLVVGGAGSLVGPSGKLHMDTPNLPAPVFREASRGKLFLDALRSDAGDLEWTMLCPAALFTAGERTGTFRLGSDTLLTGADGKSWISYEDFAVALLDEIEHPAHVRARFTVGY